MLTARTAAGPLPRHDHLEAELQRLQDLGYRVISGPKPGADNKRIAFLHPSDTAKVLVELCAEQQG